jgi:hypothetical protein
MKLALYVVARKSIQLGPLEQRQSVRPSTHPTLKLDGTHFADVHPLAVH